MIDLTTPGYSTYTATVMGEKRTFSVDVPAGFKPETGMIMFFFKGKGGSSQEKLTALFHEKLKKYNCIAIYPKAVKRGKEPAEWAVNFSEFLNDYAFFGYIDMQLPGSLPVMLSGVSNGGCFALKLAVNNGIATCTFAASIWDNLLVHSMINVYAIHGKKDNSVPYNGGPAHGLIFLHAVDSIETCVPGVNPTSKTDLPGATLVCYESVTGVKAQLLSVNNAGHAVMTSYKEIDLIDSMFEYFRKFI